MTPQRPLLHGALWHVTNPDLCIGSLKLPWDTIPPLRGPKCRSFQNVDLAWS
jgi:hypothetical protein